LSAALALRARDEGGPAVCFQLLEIPELDHRLDTPSMLAFDDTPMWNRPNAVWSWHHYLNDEAAAGNPDADVHPHASPSRATDLAGLPPAFVSVMEFDPLRDEGIDYAARLLAAGVSAELHAYPGTFHGSALVPHAPTSQQASADTRRALDRALNS
jgi:acetyl esterase/lipase